MGLPYVNIINKDIVLNIKLSAFWKALVKLIILTVQCTSLWVL